MVSRCAAAVTCVGVALLLAGCGSQGTSEPSSATGVDGDHAEKGSATPGSSAKSGSEKAEGAVGSNGQTGNPAHSTQGYAREPAGTTTAGGPHDLEVGSNQGDQRDPGSGSEGTTQSSGQGTDTGPGQSDAPILPAGKYEYDTAGSGGPRVTTLVVEPANGNSQLSTRDLRDSSQNGIVRQATVSYAPQGVLLKSVNVNARYHGLSKSMSLSADGEAILLGTNARPGDTYDFTLSGSNDKWRMSSTIEAHDSVSVGGTTVSVLRLTTHVRYSGSLSGSSDITSWIDPTRSLVVKERVSDDITSGPISIRNDYTAVLQRLAPE